MLASRVRMATFKDSLFIPEGYVMATDSDFSGTANGSFKYIGTDEYIGIPDIIKGVSVTTYQNMFDSYTGTQLKGVASFNEDVYSMTNMFYNSKATTLDLSNFDTSSVNYMNNMFYQSQATSIDVSNFDTSNVTDMNYMFRDSKVTALDLSSFNVSNVINMGSMFNNTQIATLDLSSFDTSNVTNTDFMFRDALATIGYARTQADADKFNASRGKPAGLIFVVK